MKPILKLLLSLYGVYKAKNISDSLLLKKLYKQMNLKNGDRLIMIEVDPWRRRHVYRGNLIIKGNKPFVRIRSGKKNVGSIVEWTPNWTIDV